MRALLALAALTALLAACAGCHDPWPLPSGAGRYAVWTLDANGLRGFRCDTYSVGLGGTLTATVREVLDAGEVEGDGPTVGARVTWTSWVACDLWTGQLRHHR
jgi:hypothetical protein